MEVSGQLHASAALPPEKEPLDRRLGGPQSRSERCGEEKNPHPPPEIKPSDPDRPARSLVAIPTELSRFLDAITIIILITILALHKF
jgi:hypothetical protein